MSIGTRFWTAAPLLALLAAAPAAAAQSAPPSSDTLPLHPARIPIWFRVGASWIEDGKAHVGVFENRLQNQSLSGTSRGRVVAIDGVPVSGWSVARVEMALAGPVGSTVDVTFDNGTPNTERLRRVPLAPPGLDLTRTVVTPHFVVHHAPGKERVARRAAAGAERLLALVPRPADTGGRRGHIYVVPDSLVVLPPPFWAELTSEHDRSPPNTTMYQYVAFGVPGAAAPALGGEQWGFPGAGDRVHRAAVLWIVPGLEHSLGGVSPLNAVDPSPAAPSLGAYVRERYGLDRFVEIWRTPEPYDAAVRRVLGTTPERLEAEWKRHVLSLGPDRDAGPGLGGLGLALGWGALVALGGVWVARRREVA